MIDFKPYGITVKPQIMTRKQRKENFKKFFIEEIDQAVSSKTGVPSGVRMQVIGAFDYVDMPSEESDEAVTLALMEMDEAMRNMEFYDAWQAAKKIKEVLKDCGMWNVA